jgi:hypothetical protein
MPTFSKPLPALLVLTGVVAGCAQAVEPEAPATTVAAIERLRPHECSGATARGLSAAGLSGADVQSLFYTEQVARSGDEDYLVGHQAWARLNGRPGYMIVDMNQFCHPRQVYTRDGLRLAGVTAY